MSIRLFSLQGVPEDEACEVRALLTQHTIDFYETSAGNWGVSSPALWLKNHDDLAAATALLADYQKQRAITQRTLYQQRKAEASLFDTFAFFRNKPLRFIGAIIAIAVIAYVSIKWLFELGFKLN